MFTQHRAEMTKRFICCGLSRSASINLSKRLIIWEEHHGTRWVVQRLKDMYALILGKDITSIRVKPNGLVFGDLCPVHMLSKKGRRGFRNSLRICKIYGLVKAPRVTKKDYLAFSQLVSEKHTPVFLHSIHVPDLWSEQARKIKPSFNCSYPSGETRAPKADGKSDVEYNISPEEHLSTLDMFPSIVLGHFKFFHDIMPTMELSHYFAKAEEKDYKDIVGKVVGLTKDRGMKIRFIANPYRTIQMALSRLKDATETFLKTLPYSSVFNQESGMEWVIDQLQKGKRISSIDLSNCSDNLPLEFQLEMLRELFPALIEDIEVFEEVSRSFWTTNEGVEIQWLNGQPLGTGPSFSVFTIWHILSVILIGGTSSDFRVIGDDIVISDLLLAKRYIAMMERMEVPISPSKSFYDSEIAEFAGRTIDSRGIYALYKAKPINLKNDPLGPLRQYGERGVKLVPKDLQKLLKFVYQLPPPYGNGGFTKRQLREVDSECFYQMYSKKLSRLPTSVIPRINKTYIPGETSGIPPGVIRTLFSDSVYAKQIRGWFIAQAASSKDEWVPLVLLERSESERKKVYGPLFEEKIIKEHLNAFCDLPTEEVPLLIQRQYEIIPKSHAEFRIADKEAFPISFVRKLYKLLCPENGQSK